MHEELLTAFHKGDRRALSRLLTLAARGEVSSDILPQFGNASRRARVVALTGGAGVGKSSLIGKLIEHIRRQNQTVAVLACDPESPLSGGALLGDRFRMAVEPEDDAVFIRSLAAAGGSGGIAEHLPVLVQMVEAFGFAIVLIETVGAGQGDTTVRDAADVVVLLLQPNTGDDLQWEKAGVLEVADIIVVHKADLPGAAQVEAQVVATLGLADKAPPVIPVSAKSGEGIPRLWDTIVAVPLPPRDRAAAKNLLRLAQQTLQHRFWQTPGTAELVSRWQRGEVSAERAVDELWALVMNPNCSSTGKWIPPRAETGPRL